MKRLKDVNVSEGVYAEFVCELSKPDYKVTWLRDDVVIAVDDERYKQESDETTYTLRLPQASSDMSAEYTIAAGDNRSTATLTVSGENNNINCITFKLKSC